MRRRINLNKHTMPQFIHVESGPDVTWSLCWKNLDRIRVPPRSTPFQTSFVKLSDAQIYLLLRHSFVFLRLRQTLSASTKVLKPYRIVPPPPIVKHGTDINLAYGIKFHFLPPHRVRHALGDRTGEINPNKILKSEICLQIYPSLLFWSIIKISNHNSPPANQQR